jgi:hypothetical protein
MTTCCGQVWTGVCTCTTAVRPMSHQHTASKRFVSTLFCPPNLPLMLLSLQHWRRKVAIKLELVVEKQHSPLKHESTIYKMLMGGTQAGVPWMIWSGTIPALHTLPAHLSLALAPKWATRTPLLAHPFLYMHMPITLNHGLIIVPTGCK